MKMFEEYSVGQTIIIELDGSTIMGDITLIGRNGKRIKLANTRNLEKNITYDGAINFFSSDIQSIRLIKSNKTEDLNTTEGTRNNPENISLFRDFNNDLRNKIDYIVSHTIYINDTDKLYHDAIKDLAIQLKVSLTIESCSTGRNALSASLITFFSCGSKKLYIFDMQYLRKLYPEFKKIFVESRPIKIVYDSRYINDFLYGAYNIELNGISDTFVGHLLLTKENKEISFKECLQKYLNVPKNYFTNDETINWKERPFTPKLKNLTAKKAGLNYILHEIILNEGLLKKYYDTCDSFSKTYSRNNNSAEVAIKMSRGDTDSLEQVISTDLELSADLSNLKVSKAKI